MSGGVSNKHCLLPFFIYNSTLENVLVILFAERVTFSVFMWWKLVYEHELFQWWFHMKVE